MERNVSVSSRFLVIPFSFPRADRSLPLLSQTVTTVLVDLLARFLELTDLYPFSHRRSPLSSWTYLLSSTLRSQRRCELSLSLRKTTSFEVELTFLSFIFPATPCSTHSSSDSSASSFFQRCCPTTTTATTTTLANLSNPTTFESSILKNRLNSELDLPPSRSLSILTASTLLYSINQAFSSTPFQNLHFNFNLHLPYPNRSSKKEERSIDILQTSSIDKPLSSSHLSSLSLKERYPI